jgi:hypothetical protein
MSVESDSAHRATYALVSLRHHPPRAALKLKPKGEDSAGAASGPPAAPTRRDRQPGARKPHPFRSVPWIFPNGFGFLRSRPMSREAGRGFRGCGSAARPRPPHSETGSAVRESRIRSGWCFGFFRTDSASSVSGRCHAKRGMRPVGSDCRELRDQGKGRTPRLTCAPADGVVADRHATRAAAGRAGDRPAGLAATPRDH